ncbi:MAG: phosphoethanolamine transferase [Betaproteobacteria bacterium]|nr:phosphoethanolamine transferase [Betaproteobacteria bacterium]
MRVETLALAASVYFVLLCNAPFWSAILGDRNPGLPSTLVLALALGTTLVAVHFALFGAVLTRWTVKPLLTLLFLCTATATWFMEHYRIYLDPTMLRNVLATDVREAADLVAWSALPHIVIYGLLPVALLAWVKIRRDPLPRALAWRAGALLLALVAGAGAAMIAYGDVAGPVRNHKEIRYLVTPANYLYSLARAAAGTASHAAATRAPVGEDARLGAGWAGRGKPALLVLVVGETARAANWGLSGYARQTTPELAAEDVINFASVTSCGTNTEVSLPCMFSPIGRRNYDEARIRSSESLLDVAARAGFKVVWIDNQSGCKGVCAGIGETRPDPDSADCRDGECFDGALIDTLEKTVADNSGNLLVVLHQMGNHGPAYSKRYPETFNRFQPACTDADLTRCPREAVVNAYDNAIAYTDHVLARTVRFLRRHKAHDSAFLYVSDHGESLGESGLYLHGIPFAIAPKYQTQVPMVMWLSPGYVRNFGVNDACLAARAAEPVTHDHLFHSVLGLLEVDTQARDASLDFISSCRRA